MNLDDFLELMQQQIRANTSDRNADSLPAATIAFFAEAFRLFDKDQDGYLNMDELKVFSTHTSKQSSKKRKIFACTCVRVRRNPKFRVRVQRQFSNTRAHACARVHDCARAQIGIKLVDFFDFLGLFSFFLPAKEANSRNILAKTKSKLFFFYR